MTRSLTRPTSKGGAEVPRCRRSRPAWSDGRRHSRWRSSAQSTRSRSTHRTRPGRRAGRSGWCRQWARCTSRPPRSCRPRPSATMLRGHVFFVNPLQFAKRPPDTQRPTWTSAGPLTVLATVLTPSVPRCTPTGRRRLAATTVWVPRGHRSMGGKPTHPGHFDGVSTEVVAKLFAVAASGRAYFGEGLQQLQGCGGPSDGRRRISPSR